MIEYTQQQSEILAKLSEKYMQHKCHSTASMLTASEIDGVPTEHIREKLLESPFFAKTIRHNKSQDTLAGLVDLANFVIDAPAPEAIGEMLVRRVDMQTTTRKVRLRGRAIAESTARGKSSRGKGTTTSYVSLKPESELESHSSWDENFLEDADWSVAMEEAEGVSSELKIKTSKTIIDKLVAVSPASLNGNAKYSASTTNTWSFNDVVDMRQKMLSNEVRPDAMALNPLQVGDLLKEDVFQDSLKYGDFVNKGEGYIGNLLGMDIFETSQLADGNVLMLDKMNTMLFGVRRYAMLDSYEEVQDGDKKYGVKISTRYELKLGNGRYMSICDNA